MDKEENYSAPLPANFPGLDYSIDHPYHHHHQQLMKPRIGETSGDNGSQVVDFMLNNLQTQHIPYGFYSLTSPDMLSLADVMQFTDFGPKLALNQANISEEGAGIDPVYFLKFPVLNDKLQHESLVEVEQEEEREDENGILGENLRKSPAITEVKNNKRKRSRTLKTSEEVESQRMTHIMMERNRRKQMNEHLRVLRSLMPGSYVQKGEQASIIGGAIEFLRELEQLLQCLESQNRRRLYGDPPRPVGGSSLAIPQPPFFPPNDHDQLRLVEFESGLVQEETAESKSGLVEVEVKKLGFDAMIKILSRRRPGQLIKTIAALEDLQRSLISSTPT